jgi:hypothetical protein
VIGLTPSCAHGGPKSGTVQLPFLSSRTKAQIAPGSGKPALAQKPVVLSARIMAADIQPMAQSAAIHFFSLICGRSASVIFTLCNGFRSFVSPALNRR